MILPIIEPFILTKKQMEKERKKSKNLGFPYLPSIHIALPKKEKKNDNDKRR